jgi:hypothetical protein
LARPAKRSAIDPSVIREEVDRIERVLKEILPG